jgi:hypothetical protein
MDCKSPRLLASGLRSVDVPLSDAHLRDVVASNASLTRLRCRFGGHPFFPTDPWSMSGETAAALLRCSQLTSFDVSQLRAPPSFLRDLARSACSNRLAELGLSLAPDTASADVTATLRSLPLLQKCYLYGRNVVPDKKAAAAAPFECERLGYLDLHLADASLCSLRAPALHTLMLRGPGIATEVVPGLACFPHVAELCLEYMPFLRDDDALIAVKQLPRLRGLRLFRCPLLTARAVLGLASAAPSSLCRLDVESCDAVLPQDLTAATLSPLLRALPTLRRLILPCADETLQQLRGEFELPGRFDWGFYD